jgi:ribonuclease VapC
MVIDSSAIIAILLNETERSVFMQAIAGDSRRLMSALSVVEIGMVALSRLGEAGVERAARLLDAYSIEIVPVSHRQAQLALEAHTLFGKGRHPARLNMGDCCSYALARETGEPLLFKGNDFTQTDIRPALALRGP